MFSAVWPTVAGRPASGSAIASLAVSGSVARAWANAAVMPALAFCSGATSCGNWPELSGLPANGSAVAASGSVLGTWARAAMMPARALGSGFGFGLGSGLGSG